MDNKSWHFSFQYDQQKSMLCVWGDHCSYLFLLSVPVWKVARATTAAPVVFAPLDDTYIDGGVKANNPSEFAMTEIRKYYRRKKRDMPHISLLVSVGTGKFSTRKELQYQGDGIPSLMSLIDLLRCAVSGWSAIWVFRGNGCCFFF